jgi:hypothetical protein
METISNRLENVFLLLVDPAYMAGSAAVAWLIFYLITKQPLRTTILAVSFPGFLALIAFILTFVSRDFLYYTESPVLILLPLLTNVIFPSLVSGSVISVKCLSDFLSKKPDYAPRKVYFFC